MKISFFRFSFWKKTFKFSFQYLWNDPLNVLELTGMNWLGFSLSSFPPTRARVGGTPTGSASEPRPPSGFAFQGGSCPPGPQRGTQRENHNGKVMQNEKCHFYKFQYFLKSRLLSINYIHNQFQNIQWISSKVLEWTFIYFFRFFWVKICWKMTFLSIEYVHNQV